MKTKVVTGLYRVAVEDNDAAPWSEQQMTFTPDGAFRTQNAKLGLALVPLPDAKANLAWMKAHQVADPTPAEIETVPIDAAVFGSFGTEMAALVVKMGLYVPDAEGN